MRESSGDVDPTDTAAASPPRGRSERLVILNRMLTTLNQAADVRGALGGVLRLLVQALGLETGWVTLKDPRSPDRRGGRGYVLAAQHNLPPGLALEETTGGESACPCEARCAAGKLPKACNEAHCPRLLALEMAGSPPLVHACAPVRAGGRTLGVLNVASPGWRPLDDATLGLLTQAGREIGRAIRRARLYEELLAAQLEEQAVLQEFSRALLGHADLDAIMRELLRAVGKVLRADACALLMPDATPGLLAIRCAVGWRKDPVERRRRVRADLHCSPWLVMRSRRPLAITDLLQSPLRRWLAPWVRAEGFRGHLVVPLVIQGQSIGTLVANARTPRNFGDTEIRFLQRMANQAAIAIETARLREEELQRRGIAAELDLAHDIQTTMLPHEDACLPGWSVASCYRAAQEVGGDFYDFIELPGARQRTGLVIGDVAGKSISGALLMALSLTAIRDAVLRADHPAAVLRMANERMQRRIRSDRFVSAFYGVLDPASGFLRYANAGQCYPLLRRAGTGEVVELCTRGVILGIQSDPVLEERTVLIAPGEVLVLYSDGVTEAMNARRHLFGEARLHAALSGCAQGDAKATLRCILRSVAAFTGGAPQSDDLTIVVLRRDDPLRAAPAP